MHFSPRIRPRNYPDKRRIWIPGATFSLDSPPKRKPAPPRSERSWGLGLSIQRLAGETRGESPDRRISTPSFMRQIAPNAGLFGEWLQYTAESRTRTNRHSGFSILMVGDSFCFGSCDSERMDGEAIRADGRAVGSDLRAIAGQIVRSRAHGGR